MCEVASCRNRHLPLLFIPFCRRRHHTSFLHDVPVQTMRLNDQFGMEAAEPTTALIPTGMLFLTSLGRHHQLSGILPYDFICRTQPTTTPQHWSMAAAIVPHSQCRLTQQIGVPGVRHHGGCWTMAATMVGGCMV